MKTVRLLIAIQDLTERVERELTNDYGYESFRSKSTVVFEINMDCVVGVGQLLFEEGLVDYANELMERYPKRFKKMFTER